MSGENKRTRVNIRKTLNYFLAKRRRDVKIKEFCTESGISRTTFYTHYHDINAAFDKYELSIRNEFANNLSERTTDSRHREIIFIVLTITIHRHFDYFRSTSQYFDFRLLMIMLSDVREALVGDSLSDAGWYLYAGNVISLLAVWINLEGCNRDSEHSLCTRLYNIRPREMGKL